MERSSANSAVRADAAARRAESCRARGRSLGERRPFSAADLDRAEHHLRLARERAVVAQVEASHRRVLWTVACQDQADLPPTTYAAGRDDRYLVESLRAVRAGRVALDTVQQHYLEIGGMCMAFEVDAYVHGLLEIPEPEARLLAHAAWELLEF